MNQIGCELFTCNQCYTIFLCGFKNIKTSAVSSMKSKKTDTNIYQPSKVANNSVPTLL